VGFETLYREHASHVFRYLRSRGLSEDEAADLVADTFERALRKGAGFRAREGGVRAWLFTIARNEATDRGRARARSERIRARVRHEMGSVPSPEEHVVRADAAAEVRQRVERLPEAQREAIRLRYAAGLTAREIGRVLGKSEAATQKLIARALHVLREDYPDGR
jgi:RNA polymerase sigma-70 factor (ECF subfamily)